VIPSTPCRSANSAVAFLRRRQVGRFGKQLSWVLAAVRRTAFDENARELDSPLEAPELTAETIVGGIYEVVYTRVLRGEIRELPALLPDLTYSALLPYLGPEAAAAERRRLLDSQQAA
jgi:hypothetical protein